MSVKVGGFILTDDQDHIDQMEFLLGKKIPKKYRNKLGRCFHLNTQIGGVLEALKLMGLGIEDVIYEEDRKVLKLFKKGLSIGE